ncbi:MAG: hypothetical protein ACRCW0_09020 [Clostridium sp.]
MQKIKIDDMKVSVSFSGEHINNDTFYGILTNVIKRLENEEKTDEKKCSIA